MKAQLAVQVPFTMPFAQAACQFPGGTLDHQNRILINLRLLAGLCTKRTQAIETRQIDWKLLSHRCRATCNPPWRVLKRRYRTPTLKKPLPC